MLGKTHTNKAIDLNPSLDVEQALSDRAFDILNFSFLIYKRREIIIY